MTFTITKEELEKLSHLYSDAKIGEKFNVSAETIRKNRIKHGVNPKKRRAFDPPKEVLEDLYQEMSMKQISKKFGVGETVVWKRLKEHSITLNGHDSHGHRKVGRKFSKEHLEKLRNAAKKRRGLYRGENSPHWKGGRSGISGSDRRTADYREWKNKVLTRCDSKCQDCGVLLNVICECCGEKKQAHTHHIKPYKDFPELRYDPKNGVALCGKCHRERHF